ncbi:MAG: TRAP transporter large permease subunit [Proteobacteria bacterium]|nr:TRAP transporter large permease subunit [Pseudomonadota bacterium]
MLTFILIGSLLVLLGSGIPVAFALLVSGVLAFWLGAGAQGLRFIGTVFWNKTFSFEFLAAPLFVYMGFLLQQSGLVAAMFRTINLWLGRLPGSLGVVALAASAVFAAMSGSGAAAAAALGSVMAPEIRRYGFDTRLILGCLNGGASLAPLIPPSIALIVYSTLTDTPITRLFAAGLFPGLLMAAFMGLYVTALSVFKPHLAPRPPAVASWGERLSSLSVAPVIGVVVFIVLGGIFLGWFTPSESAAVGVVVAIAVLGLYRGLNHPREIVLAVFRGSREAALVAVFIMALIVGGSVYSNVLNFLGVPQMVTEGIRAAGLGKLEFLLLLSVVLFVMGMFIDAITMQVLTVPFVLPALDAMGIDLIWFGIFLVFWIEIGTFTPPYGLHLFVLQGVMKASYSDAVIGALPFVPIWILGIVLLYVFPDLALWLPSQLF